MTTQRLDEVAALLGGEVAPGADGRSDVTVDGVATDSRTVPSGAPLFVALRSDTGDGHEHARSAVAAGAVAVLAERPIEDLEVPVVVVASTWEALRSLARAARERVAPQAVAITGSVGKTTAKDLIAAAVGSQRRVHAARGSFNNELGVPLTLLGMAEDTEVVVAEIGARHVGDIADLAPIVAPDVAVVTAVEAVHLEIFGSVEAIAVAKRELVESLGPGGVAVLNVANPRVAAMASAAPATIGVAIDDLSADVHATEVQLDELGRASGTAVTPWGSAPFTVPIAGRHHVGNALFALAVAGHLGVDVEAAAAAIGTAPVSPWRGAVERIAGRTVLDDAYNASPAAVRAALETLVAIQRTGTTTAVLGEMAEIGPTARDEHVAIGRHAAALGVDRVVAVGSTAAAIAEGARGQGIASVDEVADAAAAAELLADEVRPGDVVLVKASRVVGLDAVTAELRARWASRDETGARS
jgi:UDP-N-acetylmuramoyl-tripeptide--D-alanyl-D-alanine ligase